LLKTINEDATFVPLKWVFAMAGASGSAFLLALGVGVYAARVEGKTDFAHDRIRGLEGERREEMTYLRRIDERLSRIEGKLEK